jgi:hypothetical protein
MENSFTEYTLPGEERRKKRATAQEPGDLLDRFSNHIVMQIRVDPGVTDAMFLFAVSEDGLEYSRLGVGHSHQRASNWATNLDMLIL